VIEEVGKHPLRGPLQQRQRTDSISDRRPDLEPAGPGPDHRDVLAREVDVVIPAGSVERRSGEGLHPGKLRHVGPVQLSDGADYRSRSELFDVLRGS
jgi:hypothetical protein